MAIIKAINSKGSIKSIIDYIADSNKTDELLMSGKDCSNNFQFAKEQMETTKELYRKDSGRQYKHFVQSFNPEDNISPEKAHKIGLEWAEKSFKGFEVYISTHKDKNHVHNHFVVNSVSFLTGEKFRYSNKELKELKVISNKICERENISHIDLDKKSEVFKTDGEYRREKRGESTWKEEIRQSIDIAKSETKNIEEMKSLLKAKFNIETRETKGTISYKHPEQNRAVRGNRLGENYTKESILNHYKEREINQENIREYSELSKNQIEIRDLIKGVEKIKYLIQVKEKELKDLNKELSSTTFIQFKKKKELQKDIQEVEVEIQELKKAVGINTIEGIDNKLESLKRKDKACSNRLQELKVNILKREKDQKSIIKKINEMKKNNREKTEGNKVKKRSRDMER